MLNVQEICEGLTNKISQEINLEEHQKAVINYGLFAIVQTAFAVLLTVIFGSLFNVLVPALILSFAGVILRKYSGGVHAQTPEACAAIGVIVAVGGAFIVSKLQWDKANIMVLGAAVFICSFYYIHKLAPVDSKAKPINKEEKKQLLKRKSIHVLGLYLVLCMIDLKLYAVSSNEIWLQYIACICLGTSWQVFTLTSLGHSAVAKIDSLFNKLTRR